jgi:hypothetical protein
MARQDAMPTQTNVNVEHMIRDEARAMAFDPVRAMADFYLCDYVIATYRHGYGLAHYCHLTAKESGAHWEGFFGVGRERELETEWDVRTTAHAMGRVDVPRIVQDARTIQDSIVQRADTLFTEYTFAAIGGEVRHHESVRGSVPGGRESCWDYWHAMGETIGRERLTQDSVDLFGDHSWGSGYGGEAWRVIARTLLDRLQGRLDARTFVDRVFSLQHNGGSLLDKVSWPMLTPDCHGVGYCETIGNNHASETIGFDTLLENASPDVRDMMRTLVTQHGKAVAGYGVSDWKSDWARIMSALHSPTATYNDSEPF